MKARLLHPLTFFAAYVVLPIVAALFFYHYSQSVADSTLRILHLSLHVLGYAILVGGLVSAAVIWQRAERLPVMAVIGAVLCLAALALKVFSFVV